MSLHLLDLEASPVSQYPASPSLLSPLSEELPLLEALRSIPSPLGSPTIFVTKTFDSEVFEIPNPSRTLQSPSPFTLGPPIMEETFQLTDILGNPSDSSLPSWHEAALSGTPSSNTFGPPLRSLPASPVPRIPTPESPINFDAAALRVALFEAPSTRSNSPELQFPTITPVLPQPWENLCKNHSLNPHQFIAIPTAIGEELHPYIGDIFAIPSAGYLLWEPPAFPSVFPFFTAIYHKQSFIPAPTIISGLPAGA